jgi:23S rRNA G2069 N7-methylase RlmK/C1962 C5-methylase RlmI
MANALGEVDELIPLYQKLGIVLQKNFQGWRAAVFTGNVDLARETDLSPRKQYSLYNGTIPCKLLIFEDMTSKSAQIAARLQQPAPARELSDGTLMLVNRLKKNQRRLDGWLKRGDISCYRLYDADIPEYSVAIDIYEGAYSCAGICATGDHSRERYAPAFSLRLRKRLKPTRPKLAAKYFTKSAAVKRATISTSV